MHLFFLFFDPVKRLGLRQACLIVNGMNVRHAGTPKEINKQAFIGVRKKKASFVAVSGILRLPLQPRVQPEAAIEINVTQGRMLNRVRRIKRACPCSESGRG
jgi:hypothetical protein